MKSKFGLIDGQDVFLYTLYNSVGAEVSISNYGGIVTSIKVPDANGKLQDLVLGFNTLEEYQANNFFFGCLVGRYANRISHGRFCLDGREYVLAQNDDPNHLHGGNRGFDKVIWEARPLTGPSRQELELTYTSRDGEEGYPGNLMVRVTYRFTEDNCLEIDYFAVTDAKTVVCLTHHSYFNLSKSPTILDHDLFVGADRFTPVDECLVPTGQLLSVAGTGLDFRGPVRLGEAMEKASAHLLGGGFDHNFVLNSARPHQPAATLLASDSGFKLDVFTTEPGIQVYTGNQLAGRVAGKNGKIFQQYGGICLEAQHFPDSPNKSDFPPVILCPGQVYRQTTRYLFSIL